MPSSSYSSSSVLFFCSSAEARLEVAEVGGGSTIYIYIYIHIIYMYISYRAYIYIYTYVSIHPSRMRSNESQRDFCATHAPFGLIARYIQRLIAR